MASAKKTLKQLQSVQHFFDTYFQDYYNDDDIKKFKALVQIAGDSLKNSITTVKLFTE